MQGKLARSKTQTLVLVLVPLVIWALYSWVMEKRAAKLRQESEPPPHPATVPTVAMTAMTVRKERAISSAVSGRIGFIGTVVGTLPGSRAPEQTRSQRQCSGPLARPPRPFTNAVAALSPNE